MNCLNLLKLRKICKWENLEITLFVSIRYLFYIPLSIFLGKSGLSCKMFLWIPEKIVVEEKESEVWWASGNCPIQTPQHIHMNVQVHTYVLRGKLNQLTRLFGVFFFRFVGLNLSIYLKKTFNNFHAFHTNSIKTLKNTWMFWGFFLKWKIK